MSGSTSLDVNAWRANIRRDTSWMYHFEMARAIRRDGDSVAAIGHLSQAVDEDPKRALAHFHLVAALRDIGNNEEAEARHRQALALCPGYEAQGRASELCAQAVERSELHDFEQAAALLEEALALRPEDVVQDEAARSCLFIAQKIIPENPSMALGLLEKTALISPYDAFIYQKIGEIYGSLPNGLDKSIVSYDQSLQINPFNFDVQMKKSLAYYCQCLFEEAKKELSKALNLEPKSIWALNVLGDIHMIQENYSDAESALRQGLSAEPKSLVLTENLALVLISAGRLNEAEDVVAQGLAHTENSRQFVFVNLQGLLRQRQGRPQEAIAFHHRSLQQAPNAIATYIDLGMALQAANRHDEAQVVYRQSLDCKYRWMELCIRQRPWAKSELFSIYRALGVAI